MIITSMLDKYMLLNKSSSENKDIIIIGVAVDRRLSIANIR